MPLLMLQCKKCGKTFSPDIMMTPGASATFINNKSQCPFCHSMENIPDGTFKATVEGFINVLGQTNDPLKKANELFEALQKAKTSEDLSNLKKQKVFQNLKNGYQIPQKKLPHISQSFML